METKVANDFGTELCDEDGGDEVILISSGGRA